MPKASRDKGKAGERAAAKFLHDTFGWTVRRKLDQSRGDPDEKSDLEIKECPGLGPEVKLWKRYGAADLYRWLEQAETACSRGGQVPLVIHKQQSPEHKGRPWLITIKAESLIKLCASTQIIMDLDKRRVQPWQAAPLKGEDN